MNPAGWILMWIAIGGMTALLGWCVFKVIANPNSTEHLHSPLDIDTGDLDPEDPKQAPKPIESSST